MEATARPTRTPSWRHVARQVRARDGGCVVARLLGAPDCSGPLHAHHVIPRRDGGTDDLANLVTTCARHHPMLEALRRKLVAPAEHPRCPHSHRSLEGRLLCEARRQRRQQQAA